MVDNAIRILARRIVYARHQIPPDAPDRDMQNLKLWSSITERIAEEIKRIKRG